MDEKFKLTSSSDVDVPDTIFYIPDFINSDEEDYLIRSIEKSPKPKWTTLSHRRLQNWGGYPHKRGMVQEPLPGWLEIYCKKIAELDVFDKFVPNHVLINEYLPGQGIMPHEDGPLFYPTVTTINLKNHTVLHFYKKNTFETETATEVDYLQSQNVETSDATAKEFRKPKFSLLLKPRSLLVLRDDAYTSYLHGIREIKEDTIDTSIANNFDSLPIGTKLERGTRLSVTIRYVPKTIKSNLFLVRK